MILNRRSDKVQLDFRLNKKKKKSKASGKNREFDKNRVQLVKDMF